MTEPLAPADLLPSLARPLVPPVAPPPDISKCLELSRLFACSMQSLREIIGNHAGRHPASVAVMLLLWPYLQRVARRFEALVRRIEAGLPVGTRAASLVPRVRSSRLRRPGLPTSFAWLIRLVPYHAACVGGQVRYLLAKPEMAALFVAAPQVGRIFRPLCRMLAVAPGPDLPPGLFKPRVRREEQASALTPALSPEREKEARATEAQTYWPVPNNWSSLSGNSPRLRARPRLTVFRPAPA